MVAEGTPKPPVPTLKPGAAAPPAAGGGGLLGGIGAWWNSVASQHGPAVEHHVKFVATRAKKLKWGMPINVKVDFLQPTIEAVKDYSQQVWVGMPAPMQQAAPLVGAAVGTGLVVFLVQQRRVNQYRQKGNELEDKVVVLGKEKEELLKRINLLKARNGSYRPEVEARLATAVAEATNAAAAAADAAARAATACIFKRPQEPPPPPAGMAF
jgi:uncharacterized protein YoxC